MMDNRTRLLVVAAALAAARPLAVAPRAGLIVVLYQHPERLTAALRLAPDSATAASAAALVAAASGADAAVLIVHGAPRHTGPLLAALPQTADQIRAGGVEVSVELAVRDFRDPICWSDLDPRTPRDGITAAPERRSRSPRWRALLGCHISTSVGAAQIKEETR